jgi:hypothetical protein
VGRHSEILDENVYLTTFSNQNSVSITTKNRPDGTTCITELYLDGGIKSITFNYYDSLEYGAGRIMSNEDGLGKMSYRAYDALGHTTKDWVKTDYPADLPPKLLRLTRNHHHFFGAMLLWYLIDWRASGPFAPFDEAIETGQKSEDLGKAGGLGDCDQVNSDGIGRSGAKFIHV